MVENIDNETFIRITNKNIYDKLIDIETHVKIINGKVKINSFMSKSAMAIAILGLSIITGINLFI